MTDQPNTAKVAAWRARLLHWVSELLLVFLGVYGAFWLNGHQEQQRDAARRERILATLAESVGKSIERDQAVSISLERNAAEYLRALQAGEMPPLGTFLVSDNYSANDATTLLQAGGLDLLDPRTISALRNVDTVARTGLSALQEIQKLSDELIAPNLDQDTAFFYDPATRQLRKRFASYPDALRFATEFVRELTAANRRLLDQIQVEQKR